MKKSGGICGCPGAASSRKGVDQSRIVTSNTKGKEFESLSKKKKTNKRTRTCNDILGV